MRAEARTVWWLWNNPYSSHAWRKWGRNAPELAALVVRVSFVLNGMEFAARGYLRQDFADELLRLGKAVTQWTSRFAGDEARAYEQQFRSEVANRLDKITKTCRGREVPVLDAEVARRQWDDLALASPPADDGAPSRLLANVRRRTQMLQPVVNRAVGWRR
jgi:hypothetical protein